MNFKKNIFLKLYFTAGAFLIILFIVLYTNSLMRNIKKDVQIVPDLYSKFIGLPADVNLESFLFEYFMTEIFPGIEYPIILADSLKIPYSWENIKVEKKSFSELDSKQQKVILKKIKKYESQKAVIPLKYNVESDRIISYVYFGESKTMKQLRMMPYFEMILVFVFILLGFNVWRSIKRNEENMVWVGLAKETAHQFGSPLSSLMGWRDLLEMKIKDDNSEVAKMLNYMKTDIQRLNKIASRFGKVGSSITHQPTDLHNIIQETLDYFNRRIPSYSQKIKLSFVSKIEGKKINIDPDLIKWSLENLIKNSLDSMKNNNGEIVISAFSYKGQTYIQVKDDGLGIPKSMFKRIFYPGITSKERGWGLGLSLVKRIIEEYHHGKIRVSESEINMGTTFEIILPEV
jgi:C4-dicarboxylate-specific signal transduction histidine kinase